MTAHSLGVPEIGLDNKHAKANHTRHLIQCLVNSQPSGKGSSLEELTLDGILQSEALPGTTVLTAYWNTEGLQATYWNTEGLQVALLSPIPQELPEGRAGLHLRSPYPTLPLPSPSAAGAPKSFLLGQLGVGTDPAVYLELEAKLNVPLPLCRPHRAPRPDTLQSHCPQS